MSLPQWQREMHWIIEDEHPCLAATAKGDWPHLSSADHGRVGQIVRQEYSYLDKFAGEIQRGLPLDGRFLRRVELYTEAGRITYHQVERAEKNARGSTSRRTCSEWQTTALGPRRDADGWTSGRCHR